MLWNPAWPLTVSRPIAGRPDFFEQLLADPAPGAFPSIGKFLEGCTRRDTVIRIPFERVIDMATDGASP